MATTWKDHFLKSGLPLEFEVKKFLDGQGCIGSFDYTYMKKDETSNLKEFSYDIDAAYIQGSHYVDLMIECKYRHRSTNWIFVPEEYGGPDEVYPNSFLHPNSHFSKSKFPYTDSFPINLGKLCSKGVELTTNGPDPKTIHQATTQLSYAFAERIADGMVHQIDKLLGGMIFYHIPIVVTTANLYRLRDNVDIRSIESASQIEEVADKEDCLIMKVPKSVHLRNHSLNVLTIALHRYKRNELQKVLSSFNKDLDFVLSVVAQEYCPQAMVVLRHDSDCASLKKLFAYLKDTLAPSPELMAKIVAQQEDFQKMFDSLSKHEGKGRKQ